MTQEEKINQAIDSILEIEILMINDIEKFPFYDTLKPWIDQLEKVRNHLVEIRNAKDQQAA